MPESRILNAAEALREAMDLALERWPEVYLIGEGVADPKGIFGTTVGLAEKYGPDRVIEMPVAENGLTGVAIGSALLGQRPVLVHQRVDFALLSLEQLFNTAAKSHYVTGGKHKVPLVVRMIVGRGWGQGPQHSQSLEAVFAHVPGLKVVMPATPAEFKGLLLGAIEDDNPVLMLEHRWLHYVTGEVPDGFTASPIEGPRLARAGKDVTVVASSYMVLEALRAADALSQAGCEAEVFDLRVLRPLDAHGDSRLGAQDRPPRHGRHRLADRRTRRGAGRGDHRARLRGPQTGAAAHRACPIIRRPAAARWRRPTIPIRSISSMPWKICSTSTPRPPRPHARPASRRAKACPSTSPTQLSRDPSDERSGRKARPRAGEPAAPRMRVRYSYLPQQFGEIDDLWAELKAFVPTGDFTLGKPLTEFESRFAALIGTRHAIGVNSGTDAIKLGLKAVGVGPGDEVITAANTFVATVGAINEVGARPVFVDVDDTFCMDVGPG